MMDEQAHQIRQLSLCEAGWAAFAESWNSGQDTAESRELLQSPSEGAGISIATRKPPQPLQRRAELTAESRPRGRDVDDPAE